MSKQLDKRIFVDEMSKIFEQFGANKFSKRKIDLIYLSIRYLDPTELCAVVDDIVGNMKFQPNLSDFKERALPYMKNKNTSSEGVECSLCGGGGILCVRKKSGEFGDYAFKCTCQNGLQYQSLPHWQDSYAKIYTRQVVPKELNRKFLAENK